MPTKLIQAYRNAAYGPPAVTQKYAPLSNIDLSEADENLCSTLLMRRRRLLKLLGLLPLQLHLILPNWDTTIGEEVDTKPPLVVISSNRSKWIKKGIEAGRAQLAKLKIAQFDTASDLRALTALSKQKVSPPMYCPSRIGEAGPRNVYVVVHAAEYDIYQTNLAGSEITVVGWQFQPPKRIGKRAGIPLLGFGASRFAAIEFCKQLRTAAGEPWDYAWLMDDNVVAFTSFVGYQRVEDAMDAARTEEKPCICAGFSGGTNTLAPKENKEWAERELKEGDEERESGEESDRGRQYTDFPEDTGKGLIQQAALWNIAELTTRHLNFGPIFVTSGEDVSIGNYFDLKKIRYLYYERTKVRKENTEDDGGPGAQAVQKGKEDLTELIAESERIDARPYLRLPPPIMFKPLKQIKDKVPHELVEQTLGRFIVKTVVPNASTDIKIKAGEKKTNTVAMCQAAEQAMCAAIKLGYMNDEALNVTFKFNGDRPQAVRRVSRP